MKEVANNDKLKIIMGKQDEDDEVSRDVTKEKLQKPLDIYTHVYLILRG